MKAPTESWRPKVGCDSKFSRVNGSHLIHQIVTLGSFPFRNLASQCHITYGLRHPLNLVSPKPAIYAKGLKRVWILLAEADRAATGYWGNLDCTEPSNVVKIDEVLRNDSVMSSQ